jgi:hypothetical protein
LYLGEDNRSALPAAIDIEISIEISKGVIVFCSARFTYVSVKRFTAKNRLMIGPVADWKFLLIIVNREVPCTNDAVLHKENWIHDFVIVFLEFVIYLRYVILPYASRTFNTISLCQRDSIKGWNTWYSKRPTTFCGQQWELV